MTGLAEWSVTRGVATVSRFQVGRWVGGVRLTWRGPAAPGPGPGGPLLPDRTFGWKQKNDSFFFQNHNFWRAAYLDGGLGQPGEGDEEALPGVVCPEAHRQEGGGHPGDQVVRSPGLPTPGGEAAEEDEEPPDHRQGLQGGHLDLRGHWHIPKSIFWRFWSKKYLFFFVRPCAVFVYDHLSSYEAEEEWLEEDPEGGERLCDGVAVPPALPAGQGTPRPPPTSSRRCPR